MKYSKSIEMLDEKQIEAFGADLSKDNEKIVETAGFVPLDVKLRRFQETGQIMAFSNNEFTSNDYREMYLSPDLEITPEMEFEEIQEVMAARADFAKKLRAKSNGVNEKAGTEEPNLNSEKAANAASKEAANEVATE